jgi:hypothetical protein
MAPALETIQTLVAPVVMISANGLLCLAFYNRISAITGRSRAINKERFELLARLAAIVGSSADSHDAEHLKKRIEILDELGHRLFDRAGLVRGALLGLLIAVLCMLACSLALGLSIMGAWFGWAALGFFVAGNLAMMAGVALAIQELRIALEPLLFEHERTEEPHMRHYDALDR